MKREVFIGICAVLLCLVAYLCGRTYQRSRPVLAAAHASPTPVATHVTPPTEFGKVLFRDLANMSFADLYETLRAASTPSRSEWLTEIEQLPEGQRKVAALCEFFRALVQADPKIAADLVINLPRHRGPAMDAMVSAAPPSAMPVLAEMLLKVPTAARNFGLTDHLEVVMDEWAQVDPEAVAQFLDQHEELTIEQYSDAFLDTWAGMDHEAAWKWIQSRFGDASEFKIPSWLQGWFTADRTAAIGFALEHRGDGRFHRAVSDLAPDIYEQSESEAKNYLDRLPPGEVRKDALDGIARLATDFASDYSPAETAKFIVQFPAAEWPEALSSVLERWLQLRSGELIDWIRGLPPELQKPVVENFPEPMWDKPEGDLLPILEMPQSDLRSSLLQRLVAELVKDRYSARETVSELKLPDKYITEIANLLPKETER